MILHADEVASLATSSSAGVESAMARNRRYLAANRWVGSNNRYLRNALNHITDDFKALPLPSVKDKQLSEYIAASGPVHCLDGWAILGGAVHALLIGDPATARHLAYYAELRASLSLLATGGIGVFGRKHFVVNAAGNAIPIKDKGHGTHDAAWMFLDHWGTSADALATLGAIIRPGGVTLSDWVQAVPGASWSATGKTLFTSFGLDIKRLVNDRDARNTASYRPTSLALSTAAPTADVVAFVESLWSLMEPSSSSGFEQMDTRLLGVVLARMYRGMSGAAPSADVPQYRQFVDQAATQVIPDETNRTISTDRLIAQLTPGPHDVLSYALSRDNVHSPTHHLDAIARATFLLRLACGASRRLISRAGVTEPSFAAWRGELGVRRGLWVTEPDADERADAWQDFADAIADVAAWRTGGGDMTAHGLALQCPQALIRLGAMEVVPIWALAS